MNALIAIKDWVARNTVKITGFVQALLALLLGFEVIDWTQTQVALVMGVLAAALAFFISKTVTANARLGAGKVFGRWRGGVANRVNGSG